MRGGTTEEKDKGPSSDGNGQRLRSHGERLSRKMPSVVILDCCVCLMIAKDQTPKRHHPKRRM